MRIRRVGWIIILLSALMTSAMAQALIEDRLRENAGSFTEAADEIDRLKAERVALATENAALREENAALRQRIEELEGSSSCQGVQVAPNADLDVIVTQHPAGTSFCLSDQGVYRPDRVVNMDQGDRLIGTGHLAWSDAFCPAPGCAKVFTSAPSRIDLSSVPIGSTSGFAIDWGGAVNTLGNALVQGIEIFGAPRGAGGGCLAAIRGSATTELRANWLHHNAWAYLGGGGSWTVANNRIEHNGWGDETPPSPNCAGFANGQAKTTRRGDFLDNHFLDPLTGNIWFDIGANVGDCGGHVERNLFTGAGNSGSVIYEVCKGGSLAPMGLHAHDNVHEAGFGGARAYNILSSANAEIFNERIPALYGVDEIRIAYGQRSFRAPFCEPTVGGICNGWLPENISVHHNTDLGKPCPDSLPNCGVRTQWYDPESQVTTTRNNPINDRFILGMPEGRRKQALPALLCLVSMRAGLACLKNIRPE
jgi:hypothetical protein